MHDSHRFGRMKTTGWKTVTVVAGVFVLLFIGAAAEAEMVKIEPFDGFGCVVAGQEFLPVYSFQAGNAEFRLPDQQEDCEQTIQRAVLTCSWAIRHEDNSNNDKYPQCLPIFRDQAQTCALHYQQQEFKCKAAGRVLPDVTEANRLMWAVKRSNVRSGPGTEHAKVGLLEVGQEIWVTGEVGDWLQIEMTGGGSAYVYAPLLSNMAPAVAQEPLGPEWMILENQPCQVYNPAQEPGDTADWSGGCVDGKVSGEGRLVVRVADGAHRFEGTMRDGKAHGLGTLFVANGDRYEGEWREGSWHGRGTYTFVNGSRIEGQWKDSASHGHATYTSFNGDGYDGDHVDGIRSGQGTQTWANGDRYEGSFVNNMRHGEGTFISASGQVTRGEWKNDKLIRSSK